MAYSFQAGQFLSSVGLAALVHLPLPLQLPVPPAMAVEEQIFAVGGGGLDFIVVDRAHSPRLVFEDVLFGAVTNIHD
jgi:hypothetical protein